MSYEIASAIRSVASSMDAAGYRVGDGFNAIAHAIELHAVATLVTTDKPTIATEVAVNKAYKLLGVSPRG